MTGNTTISVPTWEEVSPDSAGLHPERLRGAVSFLEAHAGSDGVDELVIVRGGRLVWVGRDADKVHGVWSCTKSFTSTVLGLLVDDGKVTPETRACEHLPVLVERYPDVALRHFATMTSGYSAAGDEPRPDGYRHGPSATPFTPGPPRFAPGERFEYWDSAMNQFGNVLTRIAGEPMAHVFKRRVAGPIGMDSERWYWGDFGEVDGVVVNGGAGNHNKHVFISAREMARFGQLYLNRGRWGEQQVIGEARVEQATRGQLPPAVAADGGTYGFNWWVNGITPDGVSKWPGAPPGTFAASGHNNNDVFVVPAWDLVVVRLGLDQKEREIVDETYGRFLALLGEAIET